MQNLSKQTISIFWRFTKKYRLLVFVSVFSTLVVNAFYVYIPFLYKQIFDSLAANDPTTLPNIYRTLTIFAGVNAVIWVTSRAAMTSNIIFQTKTMSDLASYCFSYLHKHSYTFFTNNFSGALTKKADRFIRAYEDLSNQATWRIAESIVRYVFIIIALGTRNLTLVGALIIWTIIYLIFSFSTAKKRQKIDLQKSAADSVAGAHFADTTANNLNLKIFNGYKKEEAMYREKIATQYGFQLKAWLFDRDIESYVNFFTMVLEVGMMALAVVLWRQGVLTIGDFALIQGLIMQLFERLWNVSYNMRSIYDSLASANEMTEILTTPYEVQDAPNAKNITIADGTVEFTNLIFGYHADKIFNQFNMRIASKERLALIGSSGSGKTTLVKLLLRFFDAQGGQITIDGQSISSVTQDSLRSAISYVPQEPLLFHRSIIENIRYAKQNASDDEVKSAAKLAHAHEFITGLPKGYDTLVGERGIKLSGGERQRVAIARAILKNAPILILDEATSQLDSQSEKYIQDALKTLINNKTVIVIAHRLSTIKQMDRIIVLEKGKVVEEGTHEMLLKLHKGTYQKLWQIQAGGFS